MNGQNSKDLIILVADKNMEFAVRGVLTRQGALGIHNITYDLYVHPERDPGCLNRGHDFLRPFSKSHARALILLDREGCGHESSAPEILEHEIEERLIESGWVDCAAIVISPELENWVWSDSPHIDTMLGWEGREPSLKNWLVEKGHWIDGEPKPRIPKGALEAAIRVVRKQRSSSLYHDLATRVSLDRCTDRAFIKLKERLKVWFG